MASKKSPATRKKAKKAKAKKTPAKAKAKAKTLSRGDKLKAALAGDSSAVLLSDQGELWSKPGYYLGTRSLALDRALGIPGYPAGRMVEIFGPPASGKTTLLDVALAETQARGGLGILVDSEHARDLAHMARLGVVLPPPGEDPLAAALHAIENGGPIPLIIVQARTIEEVIDKLNYWSVGGREIMGPGVPVTVGWDSVAGTPTNEELAATSAADKFRASAAKVLKFGMRTSVQNIAESQTVLIVTNQPYAKMAGGYGKGAAEVETYGGDGIKFHASIRIALKPGAKVKARGAADDDWMSDPVGQVSYAQIIKNKMAPPWRRAVVPIMYAHGIDNGWSIWHDCAGKGVTPPANAPIVQNGSWYAVRDELGEYPSWQGRHWGLNELIAEDPELYGRLVEAYQAMG